MFERYCRQIKVLGEEGQQKLAQASILVIGAGGIGSPLLLYLAGAGIGRIALIDDDKVDLTNLHRQVLFQERDLNKNKAQVARQRLLALNSSIEVDAYSHRLTLANAHALLQTVDLVVDGSDNFQTRYLANDICAQLEVPLISASIYRNQIQMLTLLPNQGCYRCLFPEPPPPLLMGNCSLAGVTGMATGIAGTLAASISTALLLNNQTLNQSMLYQHQADTVQTSQHRIEQRNNCPACQQKKISWPAVDYGVEACDAGWGDYLILDVREDNEDRSRCEVKPDCHIPLSRLLSTSPNFQKNKLLTLCASGQRSDYAAHFLRKHGFEAYSLRQSRPHS